MEDRYIWAATWQNQQCGCAPSEDSDQPGHPPCLIRVFAVRMKKAWVLSYPLSAQRRLWSDWADAQADLSLRWAHTYFVDFVMSWLIFLLFFLWITGGGIGALCLTTQPGSCLTVNAECRSDGAQDRCSCIQGYEYIPSAGTCDLRKIWLTFLVIYVPLTWLLDFLGCKYWCTVMIITFQTVRAWQTV